MLSILNILVPVVFSERCAWAARYAARLAEQFGSQLFFLNVDQRDNASTREVFVAKAIGAISHKSIVLDGDPANRIVECASEFHADLIVMPPITGGIARS